MLIRCGLTLCTLGLVILLTTFNVYGNSPDTQIDYLKSLNIEDLLKTQVTSVSKKPENLEDTAAAIFVITSDDIKRTGARNIPEALRMVPGIQVAHIDGNKWAITSRGFGDYFSNKLLVLMDGRSVYTPLFAGVFWDVLDTVIEDIDRIEVVRGPGATLWGANGVNGVINIITRSARETEGALVSVTTGTYDPVIASARYGGAIGARGSYRLYAKGSDYSSHLQTDGDDAYDAWNLIQSGFRADIDREGKGTAILQGDIYKGEEQSTYSFPGLLRLDASEEELSVSGGNLLVRWDQDYQRIGLFSLKGYFDFSKKESEIIEEKRNTFDLDFQHIWRVSPLHEIVWGLGYRVSSDDIKTGEFSTFTPEDKTESLYSAFFQDEIAIWENSLWLTLGSKFEHNDYSGFEVQPNVRLRWKTEDQQNIWLSVSRAVRTPARTDHDLRIFSSAMVDTSGNLIVGAVEGDDNFNPEELIAYEAGYRCQPMASVSFDATLFYNDYKNLRSFEFGSPYPDAESGTLYYVNPLIIKNGLAGETYGVELLVNWQATDDWKLALGYSYMKTSLTGGENVLEAFQQFEEEDFPEHQAQLRSYLDLSKAVSFDTELYYVDELSGRDVDSYFRLDLRLGWRINDEWELSVSGENLTNSHHSEFGDSTNFVSSEVPRRLLAKVVWSY